MRKYLYLTVISLLFPPLVQAVQNECDANVKLLKSERSAIDSPYWKFSFSVDTKCEASAGGFEYKYRLKGGNSDVTKRAPDWTAADGKSFNVVDEQNIGEKSEPSTVAVVAKTVASKKIR